MIDAQVVIVSSASASNHGYTRGSDRKLKGLNRARGRVSSDFLNPLSAGDAFKRIHTVFPQLKFDRA